MTLKKFLLLPLLVSLGLFIHFTDEVLRSLEDLQQQLNFSSKFWTVIIIAAMFQICGHIIQARKAKLLFDPIKSSTTRFQFRALSIGYLFNTLLPLRLGELVRARIISGGLDLSFGFALSLIIFERSLDAAILALLGLCALLLLGVVEPELLSYILIFLLTAVLIWLLIVVLIRQNRYLLNFFHGTTAIFRSSIKHSLRFKIWSIIYGLQRVLQPRLLTKYLGLSLLSWSLYATSVLTLAQYFLPQLDLDQKLLAIVAPYFGLSVPSGPANLGVFSDISSSFLTTLQLPGTEQQIFNLVSWAVLILPMTSIGFILLFVKTKETLWRRVPRTASAASLENKLSRREDISQEMARFLENYFSGNTLSHIVHHLELKNEFRLLRYFKGGSDAITILARQEGKDIVKKIIPLEFEDRLKAQYVWLRAHQKPGIVEALGEEKAKDHYAINLAYSIDDSMLFDYMHQNPIKESQTVIDEVWGHLFKYVHSKPQKIKTYPKERDDYIEKHIFGCLEKAAKVNSDLLRAAEPDQIMINGHSYDNLYRVMDKIKQHAQAWRDIATYQKTGQVHGDVAVDNILVSETTKRSLLIDPAPDGNIINGPVFDFGKNMQSLFCGYEFLLRDEEPVYLINGNTINYREHSSAQYNELCNYVRQKLAPKHLSESEQRAIIFHAAALHIRRLKHQVYYNPVNTLKFYAVGVKTLNDFLAQYD